MKTTSPKDLRIVLWIGAGRPRADYVSDVDLRRLENLGDVRIIETRGRKFTEEDVVRESRGVHAVISTWGSPTYKDDVLAACPDLRFFGRVGGSVRGYIGDSAWARGIAVVTAVDAQALGMAEQTLANMLAVLHRLPHHVLRQAGNEVLTHDDHNQGLPHAMLLERRVGLIGFGAIARHAARMLAVFRARVSAYDPFVSDAVLAEYGVTRAMSVEALCADADVVSVHAARIPETRGILSRTAIAKLRPGAAVINTAFGDLMDLTAIEERVADGSLYLAVDNLDLLGEENRDKVARIRRSPCCLITPATFPNTDGVALMGRQVVGELEHLVRGEPLVHAIRREALATRA
ncbi:MAG: NAD(P)-dependent oxidoreductase [Planctomycetota bacterium]